MVEAIYSKRRLIASLMSGFALRSLETTPHGVVNEQICLAAV